jgi:hypothetical protein
MPETVTDVLAWVGGVLSGSDLAASHGLSIWMFLRVLGVAYLLAFLSLWSQVEGLLGRRGVLPVGAFLRRVAGPGGEPRPLRVPSLFWLRSSDGALHGACAAGVAASLCLVAGVGTPIALLALWVLYLSFAATGQVFLSYQWDVLLLEAGFLALLVCPWSLGAGAATPPPPDLGLLLLWWLLFRLTFQSGVGKLSSGDIAWRDLSAMRYHWFTQPLPTPVAWYASKLPDGLQRAATATTHVIEIGVPFLIFGPAEMRWAAAALLVGFQCLIALTGNYNFFNLLTGGLCLLLVSDAAWGSLLPPELPGELAAGGASLASGAGADGPGTVRTALTVAAAAVWLLASVPRVWTSIRPGTRLPGWLASLAHLVAPFRTINSYGLFRVMTKERPEIVLEGSRDGESWEAYEFRWKPGDPYRPPPVVQPHQPRLDWQMWFAALGSYRTTPWFQRLQARLLEGSEPVTALFEQAPFPADEPPRYLRARLFSYRFTSREEKRRTGRWWERREIGRYGPTVEAGREEAR